MDQKAIKSLSVSELEKLVSYHNKLYWDEHRTEISDYEYDQLVEQLRALAPNSKVLSAMGPSEKVEVGAAIKHKAPMLSLDKCYSGDELLKWAKEFQGDVVCSPKFDGIACSIHYDSKGNLSLAATRGDGEVGENITANVREIKDVPKKISKGNVEVRGEVFMRLSVFKKHKEEGKSNPRNLAAGAIKRKESADSAAYGLSFTAYDLLGTDHATEADKMKFLVDVGFPQYERSVVAKNKMVEQYEDLAARRSTLDYEIDGVVFKANNVAEQKRLGATNHHPRYAIAYKFQGDSGTTKLKDIEWSVGRSGTITPVVIIEPVELSGAMVAKASLHHTGFITKLGITKGAEIVVMRRGGVIPNVEFVAKPGKEKIELPTKCPSCGGKVKLEKDFLYCIDPTQCRDALIGQLQHFAEHVGMKGFGDAILAGCFDLGILKTPADYFSLTEAKLLKLDKVKSKTAQNLLAQVEKAKTMDLATFLRAFGITDLGENVSKLLEKNFHTLDKVLSITKEQLAEIHGVGEIIAQNVVDGLSTARDEIEAVRKHVTITASAAVTQATSGTGPFKGLTFVFTGKLATMDRKHAEAQVHELGGVALDSVNKALSYLVVGDQKTEEKSNKQKTADKLVGQGAPIKIISETDFLKMAEEAKKTTATTATATVKEEKKPAVEPVKEPEKPQLKESKETKETKPEASEHKPAQPVAKSEPVVTVAKEVKEQPKHVEDKPVAKPAPVTVKSSTALSGKVFVFTGKFDELSKEDGIELAKASGAIVQDNVSDQTTHVVVGAKGKGGAPLVEARKRQTQGQKLEILEEDDLIALVGRKQGKLL